MSIGRKLLIYLAVACKGNYHEMMRAVYHYDFPNPSEVDKVVDNINCNVLTMLDDDYPEYLCRIQYSPLVLFYKGDISLIYEENRRKNLAIIGTRDPSEYGVKVTKEIAAKVCYHLNVVSGLARGIDSIAQEIITECGGKTIAVLGSGVDNIYPVENTRLAHRIVDEGGLVISEYPPKSEPTQDHFPFRNRLISAFSSAVLVTEAFEKSGTSITVGFANEVGQRVMAIPNRVDVLNSFCNQLLYEGATFVRDADDVLDIMLFGEKK